MSTTIAKFFKIFFAYGTPGTLPEKKRVVVRWFSSLPRILGVVCAFYYVCASGYAHGIGGGWPRACLEHGPGKQAPLMTTVMVRGSLDTNC